MFLKSNKHLNQTYTMLLIPLTSAYKNSVKYLLWEQKQDLLVGVMADRQVDRLQYTFHLWRHKWEKNDNDVNHGSSKLTNICSDKYIGYYSIELLASVWTTVLPATTLQHFVKVTLCDKCTITSSSKWTKSHNQYHGWYQWHIRVRCGCVCDLIIQLAVPGAYANDFDDWWLEHCHCHSLSRRHLDLLQDLRNCPDTAS